MGAVMKKWKMRIGRMGAKFLEEGREWRLPGFLYGDELVLCGETQENLRVMAEWFDEIR